MISIIITAYKEKKTIKKAIESINAQKINNLEIILTAPDDETLLEAYKLKKSITNLIILKDKGHGKPAAMNFAVKKSKGNIIIFTDGDVFIGVDSLKNLLEKLKNPKIGAVTGRPISLNSKKNKFGFWAYVLTNIADLRRKRALKLNKRIFCSGYLFAIKKELFSPLSEELLSEDGYISHKVYEKKYLISYSPNSKVYVNYPNNFKDWINQKKRSAGGYNQNFKLLGVKIRSFKSESKGGFELLKYVSNLKELYWILQLLLARIYLWAVIYRDVNIKKKSREELWVRIESTK